MSGANSRIIMGLILSATELWLLLFFQHFQGMSGPSSVKYARISKPGGCV